MTNSRYLMPFGWGFAIVMVTTGAQLGGGGGEVGRPPLLFYENQKNCPDFGEKKALIVSIFVKSI